MAFAGWVLGVKRETRSSLVISSYKDTTPIRSVLHLMTLSDPHSLPKAPSPNTIILEARDSIDEFAGLAWDTFYPAHCSNYQWPSGENASVNLMIGTWGEGEVGRMRVEQVEAHYRVIYGSLYTLSSPPPPPQPGLTRGDHPRYPSFPYNCTQPTSDCLTYLPLSVAGQ